MRSDYSIVMYVEDKDHKGKIIGPSMCGDVPCARESPDFIAIRHWAYITIFIYAGLVPCSFRKSHSRCYPGIPMVICDCSDSAVFASVNVAYLSGIHFRISI